MSLPLILGPLILGTLKLGPRNAPAHFGGRHLPESTCRKLARNVVGVLTRNVVGGDVGCVTACVSCEDRIGTGPSRARTEVIYANLGYWAISGSIQGDPGAEGTPDVDIEPGGGL